MHTAWTTGKPAGAHWLMARHAKARPLPPDADHDGAMAQNRTNERLCEPDYSERRATRGLRSIK
jgi:hypothetical protein